VETLGGILSKEIMRFATAELCHPVSSILRSEQIPRRVRTSSVRDRRGMQNRVASFEPRTSSDLYIHPIIEVSASSGKSKEEEEAAFVKSEKSTFHRLHRLSSVQFVRPERT